MLIVFAALLIAGAVALVVSVRPKDLPAPDEVSPFQHLDDRKAAIYESLRDLQFEFRVGKLSDEDYQKSKQELQRELAGVMAEIDKLKAQLGVQVATAAAPAKARKQDKSVNAGIYVCPHCQAKFDQPLKFCGECGKPMAGGAA
ncbi:MAG: hypothetical protein SFV51_07630 [Bryobacteraceae bacterium]|nr:hypothetical protein [Bryobacteraceae bacterium]